MFTDEADIALDVLRNGLDLDVEFESVAQHVERDVGLVGEHLPLDDVAGHLTVDARDLVTGLEPGPGSR